MAAPQRGNLVWIPVNGEEVVKISNKFWIELGREKKRMEKSFPRFYGNKKLGHLKLKYIR